jgi:hypothetical protein
MLTCEPGPDVAPIHNRQVVVDLETELEQITCWRCENETGIATSMAVRVILAPRRTPLGRLVPGTEGWICAYCLKRGKVTSLSRY